jgi:hypothetical protein
MTNKIAEKLKFACITQCRKVGFHVVSEKKLHELNLELSAEYAFGGRYM